MTKFPIRLKDVLRAWERKTWKFELERSLMGILSCISEERDYYYIAGKAFRISDPVIRDAIRRDLHRLISKYGPNTPVEDVLFSIRREAASRTDHKIGPDAEVVGDAGGEETHGGDGNSGEMNHPAATSAPDRKGGNGIPAGKGLATPADDSATAGEENMPPDAQPGQQGSDGLGNEATETEGPGSDSNIAESERPAGQGEMADGDEPSEREMGTPRDSSARGDADDGAAGDSVPAQSVETGGDAEDSDGANAQSAAESRSGDECTEGDGNDSVNATVDAEAGHGDAGSPDADTDTHGGNNLDVDATLKNLLALRRDARRVSQSLERIIERHCGQIGRTTPRIHGGRLVRELVSRRCALHRARKQDSEIRDLVIAVDESASCAHVVDALYPAALAIARSMGRHASVLVHSNGFDIKIPEGAPCASWLRREIKMREDRLSRHYFSCVQQEASNEIWEAIADHRIGLLLALGDLDAHEQFSIVSKTSPVLLMSHQEECPRDPPYDYDVIWGIEDIKSAAKVL